MCIKSVKMSSERTKLVKIFLTQIKKTFLKGYLLEAKVVKKHIKTSSKFLFEVLRKRIGLSCLPDRSAGRDPSLPVMMECVYRETAVCIFCWSACSCCTAFHC